MADVSRESIANVSIIVPCKSEDFYTRRCVKKCEDLYPEAELIVIPDEICRGYPAIKRNWAMDRARGNIFAFLDSDAYPTLGWLENALYWLKHYPAVCGPGVLPYDAPQNERIADIVYQMLPYSYRVVPMEMRIVPEYPTFNLIVWRDAATEFENYLTGEDSLFCRKIERGIFYHPSILVCHNRRPAFRGLWKQVGTYGKHRGNFIKKALFAWLSSIAVYGANFVYGFCKRRPS